VFERDEFAVALSEEGILIPGRGYSGLRAGPSPVRPGPGISPGEPKIYDTPDYSWPWNWPDDPDEPDDFPVPDVGDDDEFPVPEIPEPATGLLLALGAFLGWRKRKQK
jgi:hypothetical protein